MKARVSGTAQTGTTPSIIAKILLQSMPAAEVELAHGSPWELLVATILSAQCTDQRVNQVTPALFKRYRTPFEMAQAEPAVLEGLIKSTGFYKNKAKHLIGCARAVSERFHGEIPATMEALTSIPGVGRKTANVILGAAFGQPAVVVDTHVKRVANRLDLANSDDPGQIEQDLQQVFPKRQWTDLSQRLLLHGRYVCLARRPRCEDCVLYDLCRWKGKHDR
ncbi:MAG TPA: endonuclease III [Nitrospira sp.]|nr:endonuclease III [Nitrospira sp.]